jgi:hypothetical protein
VLGVILSMHKQVGFLNEPKALWHTIYPGEDLIGSYSRSAAYYRLGAEEVTDQVRQTAHKLFATYLTAVVSKRVVDKYPELIFRVPFVRQIFSDAKFIFLVRNGWNTCQSIEGWSERLGTKVQNETHDWWGVNNRKWKLLVEQLAAVTPGFQEIIPQISAYNRHTDMAAVEWILTMQEGLNLVQKFPESIYMLRYEKLVNQPRQTLQQLLNFCELPPDEKMIKYACQTLSNTQDNQVFSLAPELLPLFEETMTALGYSV